MGKTKIKTIDDSVPVGRPAPPARRKRSEHDDALVEKLREELGIEEESKEIQTKEAKHLRGEESDKTQAEHLGGEVKAEKARTQKPAKTKPRSKKYLKASKNLDRSKFYPLLEALDMVKKVSYAKFKDGQGTLEAHINTKQTGIRGLISLPFASGKKLRILTFGKGSQTSGADFFGDDSTIDQISKGKIDFDILIATPEWMPKLAKVAKILGPKGLIPNPKNGTIAEDLKKAVSSFQEGKTEYKTESKGKVIHLPMGKLSQPDEELLSNVKTLLQTLGKTRIQKITLSPTMGAGVKVDLNSI